MPNFDGGHYFLTAFLPVKAEPAQDLRGHTWVSSHVHILREKLASLPTALQTWAAEQTAVNSPFARDSRTHFARLFVLDDVAFHGRVHQDAIVTALKGALGGILKRRIAGSDPTQPYPVDHLPHPWLIFVCDFDAKNGDDSELESYLRGLWTVMDDTWKDLLMHCHGWDAGGGADAFVQYIKRCRIETTMPFNDYYVPMPKLESMSLAGVLAPLLIALVLFLGGLIGGLLTAWFGGRGGMWWVAALIGLVALPVTAVLAVRRVNGAAQSPLPTGRRTDLNSVTKALYLQQRFTDFAIANQGVSHDALHAAFGEFLRTHRPEDPLAPTQPRGVVRS
jgi:hypothetical protein